MPLAKGRENVQLTKGDRIRRNRPRWMYGPGPCLSLTSNLEYFVLAPDRSSSAFTLFVECWKQILASD